LSDTFEKLPAERISANSTIRFVHYMGEADECLDRLELLLDITENSS